MLSPIRERYNHIQNELQPLYRLVEGMNNELETKVIAMRDAFANARAADSVLRQVIGELRPELLRLLADESQADHHVRIVKICQCLTYLCPNNHAMLLTGDYKSLITKEPFTSKRLYYSLAGNIYHYDELNPIKASNYRQINDGNMGQYEHRAITNFISRENQRDRSVVLELLKHNMLRATLFVVFHLETFVTRYDHCRFPVEEAVSEGTGLLVLPFVAFFGVLRTVLYYTIGLGFLCHIVDFVGYDNARMTCECLSATFSDLPSYITDIPWPLLKVLGYSAVLAAATRIYPQVKQSALALYDNFFGENDFSINEIAISVDNANADLLVQIKEVLSSDASARLTN